MSEIDKRIQDAIEKFNPTKMVFNLPKGLVLRVWENQKLQGNTPTSDIFLSSDRGEGNFNWSQSKEGQNFWELIDSNNWFGAEVLRIMGSKEAFFEAPDQSQTSDQASERIKELTQDEIQEYFDTDGKSASPSTKRLATGIDSKYAGYLVLGQFGYRIELVSKEDNKLIYSGPWKSYKPKSLINEFLRLNSSALTQMMKDDTPLFDAFNNVLSVLRSKYEPESDVREIKQPIVKEAQEEWRFKTLDEIDEEDLGYSGLEKRTILRYTGKLLTELDLGYPIDVSIKQIKNGQSISVDGYLFFNEFFTTKPLPTQQIEGYSLPIETIPSKLSFGPIFESNKGDRKSPTQSAGELFRAYNSDIKRKEELFNMKFKGNDGNWWKLQEAGGTWLWRKTSEKPIVSSSSTTATTEPIKKEWKPQDLVGKTLLFTGSNTKFLVEKFTRNNPKNKEYKLRNLTSPSSPEATYKISMSLVEKWLNGQTARGVKIIEEEPMSTDFSSLTQAQLVAKRKEIIDAMGFFEEDDQEYKELKDQLDIIETFID